MRQGTVLFRAKWTAKEVYQHTRAFGLAAGYRYAAERVNQVLERRTVPWPSPNGHVPQALQATLVVRGPGTPVLRAGSPAQLLVSDHSAGEIARLVPLARRVVFIGPVRTLRLKHLLAMCDEYGPAVFYLYGPTAGLRELRNHERLLARARVALPWTDARQSLDLDAILAGEAQ